jgi:hypothetical protein
MAMDFMIGTMPYNLQFKPTPSRQAAKLRKMPNFGYRLGNLNLEGNKKQKLLGKGKAPG